MAKKHRDIYLRYVSPHACPFVRFWLALSAAVALAGMAFSGRPSVGNEYPIKPVPFTAVKVTDGFWAPRIETNRTVTIPAIFRKCEETGRIDNFAIAGGLMKGEYKGERYNDTDVYKTIEGASYSLMVHPDAEVDRYLDGVIAKIAAAQEPDGYLYTPRTASPEKLQPGIAAERWSELAVSHELYNAGHLYEAAAAHFLATGKRSLRVMRVGEVKAKDAAADDEEDAPPASRRRLAPGAGLKPHRLVLIPFRLGPPRRGRDVRLALQIGDTILFSELKTNPDEPFRANVAIE